MLNRLIRYYVDIPLPWKVGLAALLLITGGSAAIGFIGQFATYLYAFRYGARIPMEGVPFLPLTISIISGIYLTLSACFILLAYLPTQFIFRRSRKRVRFPRVEKVINWTYLLALPFLVYWSEIELAKFLSIELTPFDRNALLVFSAIGLPIAYWVQRYVGGDLKRMNRLLLVGYIFLLFSALSFLFSPIFDSFLRVTRFGGGIEVTLKRSNGDILKANLFLLTAKAAIMISGNTFKEIPSGSITEIDYSAFPEWALPNSDPGRQLQYMRGPTSFWVP